jgi:hypothetical protein
MAELGMSADYALGAASWRALLGQTRRPVRGAQRAAHSTPRRLRPRRTDLSPGSPDTDAGAMMRRRSLTICTKAAGVRPRAVELVGLPNKPIAPIAPDLGISESGAAYRRLSRTWRRRHRLSCDWPPSGLHHIRYRGGTIDVWR